jgi:excinuclease ABC subunit A
MTEERQHIRIRGAREHNLKSIDLDIPRDRFVVITGPSGSGKSSLAFDIISAEGQRRYLSTLSIQDRQWLGNLRAPAVDEIHGLSPTVAIRERTTSPSQRATVGTSTEVHDYLRILFARAGTMRCPTCASEIRQRTPGQMVEAILGFPEASRWLLLAPVVRSRKGDFAELFETFRKQGFIRVRIDGRVEELETLAKPNPRTSHTIELVVDRFVIQSSSDALRKRLTDSLETALKFGSGSIILASADAQTDLRMSSRWRCDACERDLPELSPALFSFNSPQGACTACRGLGTSLEVSTDALVPDPQLSLDEGLFQVHPLIAELLSDPHIASCLEATCHALRILPTTPFTDLGFAERNALLRGHTAKGQGSDESLFEGVIPLIERRFRDSRSDAVRSELAAFLTPTLCSQCRGSRLREEAHHVFVAQHSLPALVARPVASLIEHFEHLEIPDRLHSIASGPLSEIRARLGFLANVGLSYLSLDRSLATLSQGELQRVTLASRIGGDLTGLVYVLDEPSAGLHPRDSARLIEALLRLRDLGNTVIAVEHDESIIRASDLVIDLGPGAGELGGELLAVSPPATLADCPASVTGPFLRSPSPILGARRSTYRHYIEIDKATAHNLRELDVRIPTSALTAIAGVSGAGKSTLLNDVLAPAIRAHLARTPHHGPYRAIRGLDRFDRAVVVDQLPIGRNPRSNPATFTRVFEEIRTLFAATKDAKAYGYGPARFSFNAKGGRCEACHGDGAICVEMHLLPDVWVTCDACHGRRYNDATLAVRYKGLNISEVLDLTVSAARPVFPANPRIARVLDTLDAVGLGYLRLGQAAHTLSGGEAQRLKLARELARGGSSPTLYLLDEPSAGLHFLDVARLLDVLHRLVNAGHTVVVVDHHLHILRAADWILELGPEAGEDGGLLIAEGPPEAIAQSPRSPTGPHLAKVLPVSTR